MRAQRRGLRIHEVPVDWIDDPDSRVSIMRTAVDDLRGVARLMADTPVARFMGVGVLSTIAYALLFLLLRGPLGAAGANALALALTAIGNTAANRWLTFGIRGRAGLVRHHVRGALVFVLTLALTNGALLVLHGVDAAPARAAELAVLVVAGLAATVTRYIAHADVGVRPRAQRHAGWRRRPAGDVQSATWSRRAPMNSRQPGRTTR